MVDGQSTNNWRVWLWAYAPLFLWLGVIFYLSSPEGAFSNTSRIIGPLLDFFFPGMPEATRLVIHGYVRKAAHFTEYAVLAFLAVRTCTMSASRSLVRSRFLLSLALVVAVAVLDEINQSFSEARTSSMFDVVLDVAGGVMATTIMILLRRPTVVDVTEMNETTGDGGE